MADIVVLNTFGLTSSVDDADAGAASFTVPLEFTDHRATLFVYNGDAATVRVNVEGGDGIRSCLGDLDVDIAQGKVAAIPFTDSMRHKIMTTDSVTVNLNDTADTAATAGVLANIIMFTHQG